MQDKETKRRKTLKRKFSKILGVGLTLALLVSMLLTAAPVSALATTNVPGDHATIQLAIDVASPGGTIMVGAGTYTEDLVIDNTKTNLELVGADGAVINGSIAIAAMGVTITGFTIKAPSVGVGEGITISATNATISGNILEDWYTAISVRDSASTDSVPVTLASVTIIDNTISDFTKGGIVVKDTLAVQIEDNIISTTVHSAAPNGIQIGYEMDPTATTGTVNNNQISGCSWGNYDPGRTYEDLDEPANWTGSGILVIAPSSTLEISGNEVYSSDVGLDIEAGSGTVMTDNSVYDNSYGFVLWNANPAINFNNIYQSALSGVYRTYDQTSILDAIYNWWGTAVRSEIAAMVSGSVDFEPWLAYEVGSTTDSDVDLIATYIGVPPLQIGISVDPGSVGFGSVVPGTQSAPQPITVTNTGNVAVNLSASITGESHPPVYENGLTIDTFSVSLWGVTTVTVAVDGDSGLLPLSLTVPGGTAPGTYTATLVFWAEASP